MTSRTLACRLREVLSDPLAIVVPECGPGDDREELLVEPGNREVALDPAAAVEHLRVGDLTDAAGDPVVAEALEQLRRAGALDLQLRERALVEEADALAGAAVLGADRR